MVQKGHFVRSVADRRAKFVTINRETHFKTDWCKLYHIPLRCVQRRMREGMTFEDALKKPLRDMRQKSKLRLQAEAVGLKWPTVYGRVYLRGWSVEKALSTPAISKSSPFRRGVHQLKIGGEVMTAREVSRRLGASPHIVGYRLMHGWREEDATSIPPMKPSEVAQFRHALCRRKSLASIGVLI